jgi:hypothetical protein
MALDDDIKSGLLEIKTLQTQYTNTLSSYQTAKDNYINALAANSANPCKSYSLTSTGVSQACYNKIWSDQKCTTTAPTVTTASTFIELLNLAFNKSKSSLAADKTLCYGTTTNPVLNMAATAVSSARNSEFITVPKSVWAATATATTSLTTAATSDACIQTCAANVACTGATYNTSNKNCTSIIGNGLLVDSTNNFHTVLIPSLTNYLLTLQKLNTGLTRIIDLIEVKLLALQPKLDEVNSKLLDTSLFETGFRDDYEELLDDRSNIAQLLEKHNDILAELNERSLFTNREHNSLRIWTIGAIIVFIFLIKNLFGLDSPAINTIFWLTIIVLLALTLSNPTGFIGMGILFLVFLMFFINN